MFKSKFKYITITLIIVALSLSAFFIINKNKENANAQVDNPIGQVTKPKATTSTTTTISTLPALPQPLDSPADPNAKVPVVQIGSIEIPKLNMTQNLYEGVELTVLNVGPGHWPGTAEPGGYGNTVIAGHRVTHSKPFRNVDQLVVGDDIFVSHNNKIFNYKVSGTEIVYPKDIWIVDQTPGFRLTLFACHPPGSASQRIVIYADLVDPPFDV
ncbi:MAG: class E sortase [Acidimicrobiia bacterium]